MPISIEADPTLAQGYIKVNGTTAATISAAGIVSGGIPAGAVMPFAMNSAPSGWLAADGTEYSKTGTYAALFAAIGTTHGETNGNGGAGTSHFRVPDLRGIFVRGSGPQTISGTTYNKALGTKEGDAIRNITGTIVVAGTSGTGKTIQSTTGVFTNSGEGAGGDVHLTPTTGAFRDTITMDASTQVPTASETRPANIALLYCIKH
jgi:hypothetical protein